MNLECRLPAPSRVETLKRIEEDPSYSHYSPCELASLLAMEMVKIVTLNHGYAVLEITDMGYKLLAANERITETGEIA